MRVRRALIEIAIGLSILGCALVARGAAVPLYVPQVDIQDGSGTLLLARAQLPATVFPNVAACRAFIAAPEFRLRLAVLRENADSFLLKIGLNPPAKLVTTCVQR